MINILLKLTFAFSALLHASSGNFTDKQQYREHKIHNIVLYPDKHSWCKTTAIVQVVGHPGCNSVKMDNNVCVGACFSYIVPRTVPETPGDVSPYCDSCQPGHVSWRKVSLECVEGQFKNQNMTKYVEFIHDCNCGACKDVKNIKVPTQDDIEVAENKGDSLIDDYSLNSTIIEANHTLLNSSQSGFKTMISSLLETLNTEEESIMENGEEKNKGLHRNVWKNLLEKVETTNSSIDSSVFNQLVQKVEEEMKVKFNYKLLKQALLKLKKYETTKLDTKVTNNTTLPVVQDTPLRLMENSKNATDLFASGLYSKISPNLPAHGMEQETASPMLDVAPHLLKPATSGSEISYHDNVEALNNSSNRTVTVTEVGNQTITKSP